jgi:hypothetical protein
MSVVKYAALAGSSTKPCLSAGIATPCPLVEAVSESR